MRQLLLTLCFCSLLTVALTGCGGTSNIKEAPYHNVPLVDAQGNDLSGASAKHLYQAGHEHLTAGNLDQALRVYAEIQSRFPFSHYATQAALETVTAYYLKEEYAKTVAAADRFIKQHPRHPHVDYLYYLRGLANYHRNDPGWFGINPDQRDLTYLRQAFDDFRLLIRNYPNSVYAKDAQMHMVEIRNRLADFELSVANYYLTRGAYVAAARRASYVISHYQRSTATPRALEIMQQAYIKLGVPELARDARAILQTSYPDYILHRRAFYLGPDADEPQDDDGGVLAWLWPWGGDNEQDMHADDWHEWLEGKPAAIIGQPDTVPDTAPQNAAQRQAPSASGASQTSATPAADTVN